MLSVTSSGANSTSTPLTVLTMARHRSASSSYGAEDYDNLADEVIDRTGATPEHGDSDDIEADIDVEAVAVNISPEDHSGQSENGLEEPILREGSYNSGMGHDFQSGEN